MMKLIMGFVELYVTGLSKVSQMAPLGAMTDTQEAMNCKRVKGGMSSKGASRGP